MNSCGRLVALIGIVAVVLGGVSAAPGQSLARSAQRQPEGSALIVRHTATFAVQDLSFDTALGYDVVSLRDGSYLDDVGKPGLPTHYLRLALPAGMTAREVYVVASSSYEISGEFVILPAQPPRPTDGEPTVEFVEPDAATYGLAEPYPGVLARLVRQTDLAGQSFAVVQVNPVQYVPREKRLILYTSLELALVGEPGYECGDYRPAQLSLLGRLTLEQTLRGLAANPAQVALRPAPGEPVLAGVEPGAWDFVIITTASWVGAFEPLADWKTRKGIRTKIVTTDWIYNSGGYSGSQQAKIRAFVVDAYNQWGALYFLLGGDTNSIPYHTKSIIGYTVPNDTYYADFDDDWACEVHVGRASVRNTAAVDTFVNKVLTYEKNPPLTNYGKRALLLGFDLDGSTHGEAVKTYVDGTYIPDYWTVTPEYDTQAGPHKADTLAALNAGYNVVNHIDHCNQDVMGIGYVNHNEFLYIPDAQSLTNGDRQSILYSLGCWAAAYDYDGCIAEEFVRNADGGGIAFVGNSRYGWYMQGMPMSLSGWFDALFFQKLYSIWRPKLGVVFSMHKNSVDAGANHNGYIFTELTLLGDPTLCVWMDDPESLSVTFDAPVPTCYSDFAINVRNSAAQAVEFAEVCLWKGGDVYLIGLTNQAGRAFFELDPQTPGTLQVTVTAPDFLPFEGQTEVVLGVSGSCYYANMWPVERVEVVIANLTTGAEWTATTSHNEYVLAVPDGGLHAGDVLEFTARDTGRMMGQVLHSVTAAELNSEILLDIILDRRSVAQCPRSEGHGVEPGMLEIIVP